MATLNFYTGLDMNNTADWDGDITSYDKRQITIEETTPSNTHTAVYTGSFRLDRDGYLVTTSKITGYTSYDHGSMEFAYSGLNVTVNDVDNFGGDAQALQSYALRGSDKIYGSSGNDTILGYAGNDLIYGGEGLNDLSGGDGSDKLYGGSQDDTIYGDAANDRLYGGAGQDSMQGGIGNDMLYGEAGNDEMDGGDGNDKVYGGDGNDDLEGHAGNDALYGDAGNDTLDGGDGNDKLYGGDGDDILYGDTGNDAMNGGAGNDYYYVDSTADKITDISGFDIVESTVNYTLAKGVEGLQLIGNATTGIGNASDNLIAGNAQDDQLKGMDGNDQVDGANGNDRLWGGAGNDTLIGGAGNDVFVFDATKNAGIDTIDSFGKTGSNQDIIQLDDDAFKGLAKTTSVRGLTADEFYAGTAAHDADDRIIYNQTTGALYYDADGTGTKYAQVQIALVGTSVHPTLDNLDFQVIA